MKNPAEHFNDSFFSKFSILPTVKSCIVIPVKDEENYILKTLEAFTLQVDDFSNRLDPMLFEILVLANNCSDNSVAIIKEFQETYPELNIHLQEITLPTTQANIGYVRRKLMECAFSRLSKNGGGVIMTTDADTTVESDWIAQTHCEINNGADVVGGRILLYNDEFESLDTFTQILHLKDEKYHLLVAELETKIINSDIDPLPRHHQHFNGSFAITTDMYAKSGGVPIVEHLEDCAFFDRLQTVDAKIRHSLNVKVYTSARCAGRTQIGLSYQLNVWKNFGKNTDNYLVESCASITKKFTQKRMLIDLWELKDELSKSIFNQNMKEIIPEIIIPDDIYVSFKNSTYFGEWYEKLINFKYKSNQDKNPSVSIDMAINDLEMKILAFSNYDLAQTSIL